MAEPSHRVLIRADAGLGMGFGHLSRCLSLARTLVSRGASVSVATRAAGRDHRARIEATGATLVDLGSVPPAETADGPVWARAEQLADAELALAAQSHSFDVAVVDHYRLDAVWEDHLRASGARVTAIDDLANRDHSADVIVDQNWYGPHTAQRYEGRSRSDALLLLGPRYAVLQPEYLHARKARDAVAHPPRRILISFGGTDVSGQTLVALQSLVGLGELSIDVVVGAASVVADELRAVIDAAPNASLHVAVPSLAPLLARTDLAIGAGGTGTWERLALRVPALVTTVSDNQSGVTRAFDAAGLVRWLGTASQVTSETYSQAFREVCEGEARPLPDIVDGYGAQRVALAAIGGAKATGTRIASEGDTASVVSASGAGVIDGGGPQTWRERAAQAERRAVSGDVVELVMCDGVPVGEVLPSGAWAVDAYVDADRDEESDL